MHLLIPHNDSCLYKDSDNTIESTASLGIILKDLTTRPASLPGA